MSLNPLSDGELQVSFPFSSASLGSSGELLLDISFLTTEPGSSDTVALFLDHGAIDLLAVELGMIEAAAFKPGSSVVDLTVASLAFADPPLLGVDEATIGGIQATQGVFAVGFIAPDAGQNDFVVRLTGSQARAIPEPTTGVILACGALAMLGRRRRHASSDLLSR
ncbi:MAG: PEP-CTERM sorting domain-containing protein [Planctomycetota bacterium]